MADAGPRVAVVQSGFATSSAFTLFPSHTGVSVGCPASVSGQVRLQFADALGANSAAFLTLHRQDGSGSPFLVSSGPGYGLAPYPPTPFGRVLLGANATAPLSFTVGPRLLG